MEGFTYHQYGISDIHKFIGILSGPLKIGILTACLCLIGFTPIRGAETRETEQIPKDMSLSDAVFLAIRNNRTLKSAYLNRVVQKYNLKVAEDEFVPNLDINPSVRRASSGSDDGTRTDTDTAAVSSRITQRIPTGADFTFTWANTGSWNDEDSFKSALGISFTQPLLRGGGIDVNTASLRTSRINEESNILSLRSTAIGIVTSTILAYRQFFQSKQQLEISKNSLERAKALLEVNQELIKAGRMARVEIVQTQADVANREFSLVQSQNALDAARLNLLQVLDIDKQTPVDAVEPVEIKSMELDNERLLDIAFKMRTDYLQSLLSLRVSEINLVVAKNNQLWTLGLDGTYGVSGTDDNRPGDAVKKSFNNDRSSWGMGLSLNIPIGDLTRKQGYISAKTSLEQQKLSNLELKENVEIEVQDAIRDVRMKLRQVELARQARKLTEQKLEIEKEKLKAGRSSNFQLVTFQNDLISSENSELDAIINYLNALTSLDQTLGTTLETWEIEVED